MEEEESEISQLAKERNPAIVKGDEGDLQQADGTMDGTTEDPRDASVDVRRESRESDRIGSDRIGT